jgi:signal peptidase I
LSLTSVAGEDPAAPQNFTADVPEGQLFLLGDERSTSVDSRVHLENPGQGSVPRSAVQARVDAVVWPMNGMIGRPEDFAALPGGVSSDGPLPLQAGALVVGVMLILGGAAYGPLVARSARGTRRPKASTGAH